MVVAGAAAALLALLVFGVSHQTDTSSIDARVAAAHYPVAPDATKPLPLLGSHHSTTLQSFRGKVVVLNVFASWCPDCAGEARLLAHEQAVLAHQDATMVGVTYEDPAPATAGFDRRYGITYPVLRDPTGNLTRAFGTFQVPETFVIDRQGRIVALKRSIVTAGWLPPRSRRGPSDPPAPSVSHWRRPNRQSKADAPVSYRLRRRTRSLRRWSLRPASIVFMTTRESL